MKVLKHSRLERTSLLHRNKRDFWLSMNLVWHHPDMLNVRKQLFCFVLLCSWGWGKGARYIERQYKSQFLVAEVKYMICFYKKVCGMHWHLRKENEVVLSYRWKFQDGGSKGMGTEWDKEVVAKVDHQKRVLCLAEVFLRCLTAFANGVSVSLPLKWSLLGWPRTEIFG